MKYILEIKPEYEDSFKGLMILGAKDSNLFVDTLMVDDLEVLNSDYINEHFGDLQDEAYHRGLAEGKKATFGLVADALNADYQRGFEDGKAVSDKGCAGCEYAGKIVTGPPCITCSNSYKNQWTAKQADEEIKVGDEVKPFYTDITGVVTLIDGDTIYVLWRDGSSTSTLKLKEVVKTGRHFDIASILKEMQND